MAEFPAIPLWTDAYLGDTGHLTTIEHGAYLLLLMTQWRSKTGLLPDDDKMLARYTRLTLSQWKRIRPVMEPFFLIENGTWNQLRLTDELNAVRQLSKRQSSNSRARWLKNKETNDPTALNGHSHGNPPTPTPIPHKTPKPPLGFSDSVSREDFEIRDYLDDRAKAKAAENAPQWDADYLMNFYNLRIRNEEVEMPDNPAGAFIGWCKAFTKGKPPK